MGRASKKRSIKINPSTTEVGTAPRIVDRFLSYRRSVVLIVVGLITLSGVNVHAQRPVRTFDPFYRGETASRMFFDRYAVTAEISYRPAGFLQNDDISSQAVPSTASDPLGLNLRFETRLATGFDVGFFIDAAGNTAGRSLSLSWLTLKYYGRQENVDYAIRLAVDPASDGRSGFPQTDLAFLYAVSLSPELRSDFAVGIRRVQLGFQQIVATEPTLIDPDDSIVSPPGPGRTIRRSRAHGWEVHMMTGYSLVFDPAGSNMFVTLIGEGGRYGLVEWTVDEVVDGEQMRTTTEFRGGVVWVRSGLEFDRPGYQVSPFLSLPLKQWAPADDDYPRARAHVGIRLMIR